jgi:hypothetical protein
VKEKEIKSFIFSKSLMEVPRVLQQLSDALIPIQESLNFFITFQGS